MKQAKLKIDRDAVRILADLVKATTNQCVGTHLPYFMHPAPASNKAARVGTNGCQVSYTGTRAYRYAAAYLLGVWDASGAGTGRLALDADTRELWNRFHVTLGNPSSNSSYLQKAYQAGMQDAQMRGYYVNRLHDEAIIEDAERAPCGSPQAEALLKARRMVFAARANGWMQEIAYFYVPLLAGDEAKLADIKRRMGL